MAEVRRDAAELRVTRLRRRRLRVAFAVVAAAVVLLVGRRIFDCATMRSRRRPTKSRTRVQPLSACSVEEARQPVREPPDHVRTRSA